MQQWLKHLLSDFCKRKESSKQARTSLNCFHCKKWRLLPLCRASKTLERVIRRSEERSLRREYNKYTSKQSSGMKKPEKRMTCMFPLHIAQYPKEKMDNKWY